MDAIVGICEEVYGRPVHLVVGLPSLYFSSTSWGKIYMKWGE